MSPTQASSSPYDPHILAAELGKLFDLPLTANMISLDGVHFRTWSGDTGVLRVELVKSVSTSQARQMFMAARIPSEEEVRRDALEAELWAAPTGTCRAERQEVSNINGHQPETILLYEQPVFIRSNKAECKTCGFTVQDVRTNWYRMDAHCKGHYVNQSHGMPS